MSIIRTPRAAGIFISLLLLCSCATQHPAHSQLPASVAINKDAGRAGLLIMVVRLVNGEKLPLVVDTGSPITAFDKSLKLELGQRRGMGTFWNFGVSQNVDVYAAPKIYLGNTPLQMAGTNVVVLDRQKLADPGARSIRGMIGMDVLQNYCLQLDFTAGKLRFLDDEHADQKNWGEAFPLTDIGDGCFSINENLAGVKGPGSVIDTGCDNSGWLQPALFQEWTNQESSADEKIYSPDGTLGGEIYHDLDLRMMDAKSPASDDSHIKFNGIGLRVLAENLVTLDFPKRMMYLKRTSDWPLATRDMEAAMKSAGNSSIKLFEQLLDSNRLPGMSKGDHGKTTAFHFNRVLSPYRETATWDALKNGDPCSYHYTFTRAAKAGAWKLQKAWRTDQVGHRIEEYPLP